MSQSFKSPESERFETLWAEQQGLCALCGEPMLRNRFEAPHARIWTVRRATYDHVIPRSKGGQDVPENLQLVHARCNKIKSNQI